MPVTLLRRQYHSEDLDARFGLDPSILATLRELNLLYGRDADGGSLHFTTALSAARSAKWWSAADPATATGPPTPRCGTPSSTATSTS